MDGVANLDYVNLFRPALVQIESRSRNQPPQSFSGVWGKPVALLVNQRTTSGKELFAYAFQKLLLGKVVGETTAGAVLAGRCFLLQNGDVLYLAVADLKVDGRRSGRNRSRADRDRDAAAGIRSRRGPAIGSRRRRTCPLSGTPRLDAISPSSPRGNLVDDVLFDLTTLSEKALSRRT